MSAAAAVTACSSCRLPITFPHRRVTAACAASNEPRAVSTAARFATEWECRLAGTGRFFEHPRDFLPGDHQPRDLLFRPGQVLRKLLDLGAEPLRLGPGSRLPA